MLSHAECITPSFPHFCSGSPDKSYFLLGISFLTLIITLKPFTLDLSHRTKCLRDSDENLFLFSGKDNTRESLTGETEGSRSRDSSVPVHWSREHGKFVKIALAGSFTSCTWFLHYSASQLQTTVRLLKFCCHSSV